MLTRSRDDLTVQEHVKLMYNLKATHRINADADLPDLIGACDLVHKRKAKSKTLSGGQKRKLQLAMMFAGGSSICCIDEVSSGLDPLSRRKIWDILLAERGERTIIMTTHFLDEADFLSDHIVILSTGHLKAEGSSAGLKQKYGEGYTIQVPVGTTAPHIEGVQRTDSLHGTKYTARDPMSTTHTVDSLERAGLVDFRVSGPTLEEVFLKLAAHPLEHNSSQNDSSISITNEKPKNNDTEVVIPVNSEINLHNGKRITPWRQGWLLYRKRWMIFRRNYFPMLVVMAIALIGAGVCPIFLKYFRGMQCSVQADDAYTPTYKSYIESLANDYAMSLVGGPSAKITDKSLAGLAEIYSPNHTWGSGSIENVSVLHGFIAPANTYQDFNREISLGNATVSPGGFWLGDDTSKPTFAWLADPWNFEKSLEVQNILNNMLLDGRIVASFSEFDVPDQPIIFDFAAIIFAIYYSLVLCLYPGFYALYPTVERLRNARAMQYSNGVRPLSLWLSYVAFDLGFTLFISIVSTVLLSVGTRIW